MVLIAFPRHEIFFLSCTKRGMLKRITSEGRCMQEKTAFGKNQASFPLLSEKTKRVSRHFRKIPSEFPPAPKYFLFSCTKSKAKGPAPLGPTLIRFGNQIIRYRI